MNRTVRDVLLFLAACAILYFTPKTGGAADVDPPWEHLPKENLWRRDANDNLTLQFLPHDGPQYLVTLRCENGYHETIAWREGDPYGITTVGCNGKSGEPRFIRNLKPLFDSLPGEARSDHPPAEIYLESDDDRVIATSPVEDG